MLQSPCDIEKILHRVPLACQIYQLKFPATPRKTPCRAEALRACWVQIAILVFAARVLLGAQPASAQQMAEAGALFQLSAQAIGVATRESPAIHGRDLSEGYLTQPVIMAQLDPWKEML